MAKVAKVIHGEEEKPKKKSLYHITAEWQEIEEKLKASDGDISALGSEEEQALFMQFMADTQEALETKLDGYGAYLKKQQAEQGFYESEAKRFAEQAKVHANRVARLKLAVKTGMEILKIEEIKTPHFRFKIQKNGSDMPIVYLKQAHEIVERFPDLVNTTHTFNADMVRAHLEASKNAKEEIEGECGEQPKHMIESIAYYGERGTHLRIY